MTNPADKVQRWPIEKLTPYARNSRTHSDTQVAQIAASIREWGWTTPVLVDEGGGIIAGHGRVLAARQLGMTDVPVVIATGWSDAKRRAYVIADNKLALNAGWDAEMLALELGELGELGFDLDLTGFSEAELGSFAVEETTMPTLDNGDKKPFQQKTFTLHDEQVEDVEAAVAKAKEMGHGESGLNENSNGNALAFICQSFNRAHE